MVIILPDDVQGLKIVEDKLIKSNFEDILSSLMVERCDIEIPKFQLTQEMNLNNVLKKVSMLLIRFCKKHTNTVCQ